MIGHLLQLQLSLQITVVPPELLYVELAPTHPIELYITSLLLGYLPLYVFQSGHG